METIDIVRRNVNHLRLQGGLSLLGFAALSGVSKSNIWKIETGKTKSPSMHTLEKLAESLGVSLACLLTDDRTMKSHGADYITNRYLSLSEPGRLKMHKIVNILFDEGVQK